MKSMYTNLLYGVVLSVGVSASAYADTMFLGTMKITARSSECTNGGMRVGDVNRASFHPKALAGNENFSSLNWLWDYGADSNLLEAKSFTSSFQSTVHSGVFWKVWTSNIRTYIRVTSQTPAALTASTPSVTLVGQIMNPYAETGQEKCIVSFNMVGVSRQF